jgi:hypothetical protein
VDFENEMVLFSRMGKPHPQPFPQGRREQSAVSTISAQPLLSLFSAVKKIREIVAYLFFVGHKTNNGKT